MGNSTKKEKENKTLNLDAVKPNDGDDTAVRKLFGKITGCSTLNVRAEPSVEAEIVSVLRADAEVTIDEEGSTEDFYKVCTGAAIDGYCMRQYVTLQK